MCCACCERITHKPGYICRLPDYVEVAPRCVLCVGWQRRGLCPTCTARIERGYQRRAARRHARRSLVPVIA